MVWFQCESCGESLKKPKLAAHFRSCAARKLACIDCGVEFDQQSVQMHTTCITEAEKYGPKGQPSSVRIKPAADNSGVQLTLGLSVTPPWHCTLCNVNATSYDTLAAHGQGKKHVSRARAAGKVQEKVESKENRGGENASADKEKKRKAEGDVGAGGGLLKESVAGTAVVEEQQAKTKKKKEKFVVEEIVAEVEAEDIEEKKEKTKKKKKAKVVVEESVVEVVVEEKKEKTKNKKNDTVESEEPVVATDLGEKKEKKLKKQKKKHKGETMTA